MGYLTDPDDPADLDEFLIITYTRAAAAELRGKIAARLGEMLAEDPDNKHLQRQLTRVYLAQISTVHAFCQTVLRQYAAEVDLPADFRVADEQQAAALRAEALQDTLAELYAGLDANPDFAAMIDTLGYGRDDRRLLALAEESYGVMRCQVDPAAWTRRCLQAYDLPEDAEAEQTLWGAWFLQERTRVLENADALLRQAEDLCRREPKLEEKCTPVLEKNRAAIRDLLAETTWDSCMEKKIASFGAMRPPKDAEAVEQVKALRKEAWEMVKDIQRCFYAPSRQVTDDLRRTVPALRGLLALLKAFDERFTQEKRRRHLLDFSDLEHCMIRLLTKKGHRRAHRRRAEPRADLPRDPDRRISGLQRRAGVYFPGRQPGREEPFSLSATSSSRSTASVWPTPRSSCRNTPPIPCAAHRPSASRASSCCRRISALAQRSWRLPTTSFPSS